MRSRWIGMGLVLASLLLWGLAGAAEPGSEGEPQLVHDFFPGEFERAESLKQLTQLGNTLFFVADDLETEPRVWQTDGTPEGTRQVQATGRPEQEGDHQSIVGALGRFMLWVSVPAEDPGAVVLLSSTEQGDGVPLHTYRPGPGDLFALTSRGFFFQDCTAAGCQVWSTDGTAAGTRPVSALAGRFAGRTPQIAGTFADRWLLLRAGRDLFAYDFVTAQVQLLLPDYAQRTRIYPAGNTLFFLVLPAQGPKPRTRLWASRLEAPRAVQVFESLAIHVAGKREGRLYFSSGEGRLWSSDGRPEGTRVYSGIRGDLYDFSEIVDQLGTIGSTTLIPMPGYYFGGLLGVDEAKGEVRMVKLFCDHKYTCPASMSPVNIVGGQAFEAVNGRLWQSDGTREGTRLDEIFSKVNPGSLRSLNGRLLLGGKGLEGVEQLWETDGTAPGTRALSDGTPDRPFLVEEPPVPVGGGLFVVAERKPVGQQLWRVADGRATPLTSVRYLTTGINPYIAFPVGGRLVFIGEGTYNWRSLAEGGSTGPLPIDMNLCFSSDSPCSKGPVVVGNHLFFSSEYPGEGLGFTDGTVEGTGFVPLNDEEGIRDPVVLALGRLGERALALGPAGGLWTSDGTAAGTRRVARLPKEPLGATPVGPPVSLGSLAVLFRRVPVSDNPKEPAVLEVWRTDGTEAGTLRLASTPFPKDFSGFLHPVTVGGRLFFRFGGTLWVSDGSVAGTHPLQNQLPGGTFSLAAGPGVLYAGAGYQDGDEQQTLWAIDPTTLSASLLGTFHRVADGNVQTDLGSLLGDTLFFRAADERNVERWWVTEGTPESTHRVPGLRVRDRVLDFFTAGDRRYFTSCDPEHGCELWSTDRLGEDTRLVKDLWPGPRESAPQILAVDGGAVWFAATEPSVGRELWTVGVP